MDDTEKLKVTRKELPQVFCGSRAPSYVMISESGLYRMIVRSNKPEAQQFQDWVTKVVLPSVRMDGGLSNKVGVWIHRQRGMGFGQTALDGPKRTHLSPDHCGLNGLDRATSPASLGSSGTSPCLCVYLFRAKRMQGDWIGRDDASLPGYKNKAVQSLVALIERRVLSLWPSDC